MEIFVVTYWSHFKYLILMDLFFILSCICLGVMLAIIFDTIKNCVF